MGILEKFADKKYFTIYLLTFTNGISFALLIPVLPSIIRSLDQPEIFLGLVLGTYSFFQFFATPIIGKLSDLYGRRKLLLVTQFGTFLSWIILGAAYFLPEEQLFGLISLPLAVIFFSRAIDGITGGNVSVARAVVADKTDREHRSEKFGKLGAVTGLAIIAGPALGSLSQGSPIGFAGTAIVGGVISLVTLCLIYFYLRETLPKKDSDDSFKLSAKDINIFARFLNWKDEGTVEFASVLRVFIFIAFIGYTSVSTLYLLDTLGFSDTTVGYFIAFTGSFIIIHQNFFVPIALKYFGDTKGILLGLFIMGCGFLGMAFSGENIYFYTLANFINVFGIALCFSTNNGLFSNSVDEKYQGEILGFSASIKSFVSIWVPALATFIYSQINFSIYYIIGVIPLIAFAIGYFLYYARGRAEK